MYDYKNTTITKRFFEDKKIVILFKYFIGLQIVT